jgi:serine/threonine-protein kinase
MYSLGATIYHLLTGRPPFEGKSAAIVMMKHIEEQLPSPQEINPNISDDICAVIGKMMAKAPEDRYSSCDEVVADLERAVQGLPPMGEPVPSSKSSMRMPAIKPQVSAPAPAPQVAPQQQPDPRYAPQPPYTQEEAYDEPAGSGPNSMVIAGMACVIVLLIALIVFLLLRSQGQG